MTHSPQPDLNWARQFLTGFSKYEKQVNSVKVDEQRYKEHPGYVPEFKEATP